MPPPSLPPRRLLRHLAPQPGACTAQPLPLEPRMLPAPAPAGPPNSRPRTLAGTRPDGTPEHLRLAARTRCHPSILAPHPPLCASIRKALQKPPAPTTTPRLGLRFARASPTLLPVGQGLQVHGTVHGTRCTLPSPQIYAVRPSPWPTSYPHRHTFAVRLPYPSPRTSLFVPAPLAPDAAVATVRPAHVY